MQIRSVLLVMAACLPAACDRSSAPEAARPVPVREQPVVPPVIEPVKEPSNVVPESFIVSTNEPFWQARVEGATLVLAGPEGEQAYTVERNEATSSGRHVLARGTKSSLEVQVTAQACEDDMSGAAFPFSGSLSFDGAAAIRGCARPASQSPPGEQP